MESVKLYTEHHKVIVNNLIRLENIGPIRSNVIGEVAMTQKCLKNKFWKQEYRSSKVPVNAELE